MKVTLSEEGQKDTQYGRFFYVNWPTFIFSIASFALRLVFGLSVGWLFGVAGYAAMLVILLELHEQLKVKVSNQL
jgi:hypothetical protein